MKARVNLESKLKSLQTLPNTKELSNILDTIWDNAHQQNVTLLERVKNKSNGNVPSNHFKVDKLNKENIYHITDIKKICIDYRLRFLPSHLFKANIPLEAITKIKDLEKKHETAFYNFKIIAPSKLFRLKKADDPLLFIPIGDGYYYFVHKWGKDIHLLRKSWAWCFKSFENLLFTCFIVSILLTLLLPDGLFITNHNPTIGFIIEVLFMFKSVAAVVMYYGFAKGKNFNSAIWNSQIE